MVGNNIVQDPSRFDGKPYIRNTEVTVAQITELAGQGTSLSRIKELYPEIKGADLTAALLYSAEKALTDYEGAAI